MSEKFCRIAEVLKSSTPYATLTFSAENGTLSDSFAKAAEPEKAEIVVILGPSGVGKTYSAKQSAAALTGNAQKLITYVMADLTEPWSVARLIGVPPGYIGFKNNDRALTEQLLRDPFGVLVMDEFEKAHPMARDVIKGALANGFMPDVQGRKVSLKGMTVFIVSSLDKKSFIELMKDKEGKPLAVPYTIVEFSGEDQRAKKARSFNP
jgi:ATP-dependent Clp protease ATP-binding subunit ClpC